MLLLLLCTFRHKDFQINAPDVGRCRGVKDIGRFVGKCLGFQGIVYDLGIGAEKNRSDIELKSK